MSSIFLEKLVNKCENEDECEMNEWYTECGLTGKVLNIRNLKLKLQHIKWRA